MEFCKIAMKYPFSTRHPSQPCLRLQGERKAGMALVIVLGLIALLLISSVTFAIMMRIERASSANARNTTMARQSAKSALACALAAIDHQIGTNKWAAWQGGDKTDIAWDYDTNPDLPLDQAGGKSRTLHFWKDTFGSVDHNINKLNENRRATARLLSAQMQDYLPYGIRHRAYAQRYVGEGGGSQLLPNGDYDAIAPEWVPMTAGTNAVNVNNVIGRSAFLAFDTSGYLDLPAVCASGRTDRAYGRSPTEIQPISKFFYDKHDADELKENNKGFNFENVAEIRKAKANVDSNNKHDGTVFGDGAAFSAFNFCPTERMPAADEMINYQGSSRRRDQVFPWLKNYPFKNKICIAGDGGDKHLESLRAHKAAIIAAFMMSGLTASSGDFSHDAIKDNRCTVNNCTVCGKTAGEFTLPKYERTNPGAGVSEQALMAYLGLIDYIDGDDYPEPLTSSHKKPSGDAEEYEAYARPAAENVPLFNGFMATIKFTRSEWYKEETFPATTALDGTPIPAHTEKYFDSTNMHYSVELNGKVLFANRCAEDVGETAMDDMLNLWTEARLGFYFEGDDDELWENFAGNISFNGKENGVDSGEGIYGTKGGLFCDGPIGFFNITNSFDVKCDSISPGSSGDADEALAFPSVIWVGAAGQALTAENGDVLHRFPAYSRSYDSFSLVDLNWLVSSFDKEKEGADWKTGNSYCKEEKILKNNTIYANRTAAMNQDRSQTCQLNSWSVTLILWGEPLDPRFSCRSAARYPSEVGRYPKTVFTSHTEESNENGWERSITRIKEKDGFGDFDGADDLVEIMKGNGASLSDFDDFVDDFKHDLFFFGDYFDAEQGVHNDRQPAYSALQSYLLTNEDALEEFKGVTDGSRRTELESGNLAIDSLDNQFQTAYVRNDGLDSVGELGFLPIGPYATIRLFGFADERTYDKNGIDTGLELNRNSISTFNQVSKSRPFHRVLDFFGNSYKPVRGLINLNSGDSIAVASIFNGVTLNDFYWDSMEDAHDSQYHRAIDEEDALETVVPALYAAFDKRKTDGTATGLSDIGWFFDTDRDYYDDLNDKIFKKESGDWRKSLNSNLAREALIRNTCGLFTTRGINMTILLRGEAFTPFFGRSDVRNDLGTTLASRSAIAQVWRDTEPDDDGKYPYFVQFFKIFDD